MCFDCLLAFPPFSSSANVGAKRALSKLSRPNTPAPEFENSYGPPLEHDLNQEDLPDVESDVELNNVKEDDLKVATTESVATEDDGFGEGESECHSMDPSTGMELDAVVLVDMESPAAVNNDVQPDIEHKEDPPTKYVYEKEVEIETSLDEHLPVGSGDDSSVITNATTSTIQSMQKPEPPQTDGKHTRKEVRIPGKVVGHLDISLEYDESSSRLKVVVMQASGLPNKNQGGFSSYRVRLYLRPNKQQSSKTRIRPADAPVFRELFRFRQLPKDQLTMSEILFKLHGCGKYGKEKLVGDATLNLTALKAAAKQSFKVPLVQSE